MPDAQTARVIKRLKQVCRERGLTPSAVYSMLPLTNGQPPICQKTVSRVFAEGSENVRFNYTETIQPIAAAVLGTDQVDDNDNLITEPFFESKAHEYYYENNALREIIRLRALEEERLRTRLDAAEQTTKDELAKLSLLHDQNINRLLMIHQAHDDSQATVIRVLEQNNAFLQQTLERAQKALQDEREAKKRMYDDYKRITQQEIDKSKSNHEE